MRGSDGRIHVVSVKLVCEGVEFSRGQTSGLVVRSIKGTRGREITGVRHGKGCGARDVVRVEVKVVLKINKGDIAIERGGRRRERRRIGDRVADNRWFRGFEGGLGCANRPMFTYGQDQNPRRRPVGQGRAEVSLRVSLHRSGRPRQR